MELKGAAFAEVRDAIVRAFNSSEFDMFLYERLEFDREVQVGPGPFKQVVDMVLKQLVREGREWQLIQEVALVRPLKQEVQDAYRKYAQAVLSEAKRAEVDRSVREAYEGLGLAPHVQLQIGGVAQPSLESAFGAGLQAIVHQKLHNLDVDHWRALWSRRERCVCRVEIGGQPVGTGFLVGPEALLTNYHVLENAIGGKHSPSAIVFRFDYKKLESLEVSTGVEVGVHEPDWLVDFSPYSPGEKAGTPDSPPPAETELDFALVRLARSFGVEHINPGDATSPARGWIGLGATPPPISVGMPLLILQHPRAAPLKLGVDTRAVISANALRVRYATNTESGSSGSPCFDFDWNLVALHHYGDPAFKHPQYNQGIPIRAIRQRLEASGKQGFLGDNPA